MITGYETAIAIGLAGLIILALFLFDLADRWFARRAVHAARQYASDFVHRSRAAR